SRRRTPHAEQHRQKRSITFLLHPRSGASPAFSHEGFRLFTQRGHCPFFPIWPLPLSMVSGLAAIGWDYSLTIVLRYPSSSTSPKALRRRHPKSTPKSLSPRLCLPAEVKASSWIAPFNSPAF